MRSSFIAFLCVLVSACTLTETEHTEEKEPIDNKDVTDTFVTEADAYGIDWIDHFTIDYMKENYSDITLGDTTVDLVYFRDTLDDGNINIHITWWFEHHLSIGHCLVIHPSGREIYIHDVTTDSLVPYI